ncbi:hypothetical protein [Lacticaseibacillus daqingensis]|uniref:hypothetical protein n=1 Tax=Lacticaseibacillus daqingensis TaxID=2486014 RepID=UPI000F78CBF9|nr:hypothetical protein [Lacticaseibacillus daqingensis]
MIRSIRFELVRHAALGRWLVFAGGALAAVLYALLAMLADPALMQAIGTATAPMTTLIPRYLWALVGALGLLEGLALGYVYQVMMLRYRSDFRLYRTLGMSLWYMAGLLLGENLIWAVLTGGIGVVAGVVCSKFWVMWLVRMMALKLSTGLLLSGRAAAQVLVGYVMGYAGLAISGWLRLCEPLNQAHDGPFWARHRDEWWQRGGAVLAPLLLLVGEYGLSQAPQTLLAFSGPLLLTLVGLGGVCAFTLPTGLALLARASWVRRRASWLLSVTAGHQVVRQRWRTITLTAALLSVATGVLLGGLIQYRRLHTIEAPGPLLVRLGAVGGSDVDAVAGIALFSTTVISFAMMIAAAVLLGLVQRLAALTRRETITLRQLGMPQSLLARAQRRQAWLVGGLPFGLGGLIACGMVAERADILNWGIGEGCFVVVYVGLYLAVVQTTSRSAHTQ